MLYVPSEEHLYYSIYFKYLNTLPTELNHRFIQLYVRRYYPDYNEETFLALVKHTRISKLKRELFIGKSLIETPILQQMLRHKAVVFINLLLYRILRKGITPLGYKFLFDTELPIATIRINRLAVADDQNLLRLKGVIKTCTSSFPVLRYALYVCSNCRHQRELTLNYFELHKPRCLNNCRHNQMVLDQEKSLYIDVKKIQLQELQENLEPGQQPRLITCFVDAAVGNAILPGKEHVFTGVLQKYLPDKTPFSLQYLQVLETDMVTKTQKTDYTKEEVGEFQKFYTEHPDILDTIGNALFTGLLLPAVIKQTVILQLVGGCNVDGRQRSDIHVLLVGDPGSGKSEVLRTICRFMGGIFSSGVTSSGPGLTAAVVKDSLIPGRWGVEVGAFVFADRGLLALDEIDKVKPVDIAALHQAMEQQTISIAKAGILMTLNSRCAVLAAANPQFGKFVEGIAMEKQITIPLTILNRFDIVYFMKDPHSQIFDAQLVQTVLNKRSSEPVSNQLIRQYLEYVRTLKPSFNKMAQERIKQLYAALRAKTKLLVSARQLHAIIRLSEASAKLRCATVVSIRDVQLVSDIIMASLTSHQALTVLKETGVSHKKSKLVTDVYALIKNNKSMTRKELLNVYDAGVVDETVSLLLTRNLIYEPHPHTYEAIQ